MRMNPYEVLGVSRNASIDEIKKAYKELSRKYHPDSYVGNPLSSLAEEKFKQVQEAYDAIMKEKNGDYNYAGNYNNNGYNNSESGEMAEVYNLLGRRAYSQALSLLDSMPNRNAKWYYYSAIAQVGLGNNLRGMEYARMAVSMEPNNIEYQNLVNRLSFQGNRYGEVRNVYRGGRSGFDDATDLCCKLWLADSLCECMGGDLCSCM
ncbi:J domain-containing protein [Catonella sp. Marseille-Q4567]|uniref:J domain-containing protein n=2 Tax=Catonella massiliensis TaxID=2799636 RepID=A0ABS1IZW0_9FIRM|nr:J domain-containing protein [Catonella massiliensis]MBK5897417.1 J domain-containing protein [Catonella massiliensis]